MTANFEANAMAPSAGGHDAGTFRARLAGGLLFLLTVALLWGAANFASTHRLGQEDAARFACYFAVALFAASLKVRGRELAGTTSMSFVFVIVALVELRVTETVIIAGPAILIQGATRRLSAGRSAEILEDLSSTLTSAVVSQYLYHSVSIRSLEMEAPVRLVFAAVAGFLISRIPTGLAVWIGARFRKRAAIARMCLWSFPYHLVAATVTALYSSVFPFVHWYSSAFLLPLVYLTYVVFEIYVNRMEHQRAHATRVSKLHMRTIETLALAIEAKDHTTHDHLQRVQTYALEVGRCLGLNEQELQALQAAAVLHDIGKLAVPEHIVSKPGKLTPEEFEKMKIHPIVGAEILERVRFPYPVAPIVRAHHEKWDGSGYPEGLKGEAIPLGARILTAVDCLDALSSDRQYRRALPIDQAMSEVAARAGKDFDPQVIDVLSRRYRDFERLVKAAAPIRPLIEHTPEPQATVMASLDDHTPLAPPPFLRTIGAAREEVQKLFELTQELGTSLELRDIFGVLSRGLAPLVPYDAMALFLENEDSLVPEFLHGPDARVCSSLAVPRGSGITGWVVANSKAAVNCDPAREGAGMDLFSCAISVPLSGRSGVVAALTLYSRKRQRYGADHLRLMNAFVPKLSLAVENALTLRKAESSATTDYLTGLPNAQSLFLRLDREVEVSRYQSAPLGVLVCDLNGFKHINDTQGHLMGNQLLQEVAKALQARCGGFEYVARMGGDEFVIVCSGMGHEPVQRKTLELREAIREVGDSLCGTGLLDASFGAALYPEDGETADELLAAADRRMYQDKSRSKSDDRRSRREGFAGDRRKAS